MVRHVSLLFPVAPLPLTLPDILAPYRNSFSRLWPGARVMHEAAAVTADVPAHRRQVLTDHPDIHESPPSHTDGPQLIPGRALGENLWRGKCHQAGGNKNRAGSRLPEPVLPAFKGVP